MVATRPLTIAEFEASQLDGLWELIDGEPVRLTPSSDRSSWIATEIAYYIRAYLRDRPIGRVFGADAGFILFADRDTVRAPDAAFVTFERLPELTGTYVPIPPDLAVEVLSPTHRLADALSKASMYLQAGVPLVWLIDPRNHTATIFRQDKGPITIEADGVLDGEQVLPGFTLPLAQLFA